MKKKVLITGASSSLGLSIARKFAQKGYDLILLYNTNRAPVIELKSELENKTDTFIEIFKVDLENEDEIIKFASSLKDVDVLINNASYNDDDEMFKKSSCDFIKTYKINAIAPFLLAKHLKDTLIKNRGVIVNVSSTNGIDTMYQESVDYDASKAALINITKNLAKEFAPTVRVNAIAPGWINTSNTIDMEEKFKKVEMEKILLGRFSECEEIANVVYFLASDEASYINGSVLIVDGGRK